MTAANIFLNVNSVEVIYNHVILVLKGVSFNVPEGSIVALLGGNGAGKTTTLRAVSNLLHGERGEVTKGSIELKGERVEALTPADLVKRGVVQVMEGRHCFGHLTIEENLMTGAYTRRDGKGAVAATLEKVYTYFPRLKTRRTGQAAYTSGGEQQMCAIGRALMAEPKMVLLDYDAATDALFAVGTVGAEQFDAFFAKYDFKLAMEFGQGRARQPVAERAIVREMAQYCRQTVEC